MIKCKNKLISRPLILILFLVGFTFFTICDAICILSLNREIVPGSFGAYLFSIIFVSILAISFLIFFICNFYCVKFFDDVIIFKGLLKKYVISRDKIKNIYISYFGKESDLYIFEVEGYKILKNAFRIESRRKSKNLIESFWDKPINRVKLESLIEIKK